MREILFKAKRKNWKELPKEDWWVEGYYLNIAEINHFICTGKIKLNGAIKGIIAPEMYAIDINTLCQYTGLTDKNGKRIWENDICDRKEKYPEIVTYNKGDWQLDYSYVFGKEIHHDACNLGFYAYERNCVEVIGNIFDNPELSEVE
ncbi:hypothetical protein HMPREF9477_00921 [Lachnospiraceae bacterium 2_1_46FAA]|nr:hypothetical protein HMPREF9477_00921 [Lachnospiraceae bacterium 2_1_46FAA]